MIRHRIGENVIPKKLQVTALHGGILLQIAAVFINIAFFFKFQRFQF
jgi:hypothetical protein